MELENVAVGDQDSLQRKEWRTMKKLAGLAFSIIALAAGAAAQTTVTTSGGTTNTVPVFTGTSTVGNSPIAVSGSNVGIGTTSPGQTLTVSSGNLGITGINAQSQFTYAATGDSNSDIWFNSLTSFANNGADAAIYLARANYQVPGSGNDLNDQVGLHINGFYQNSGLQLPIYLGGFAWGSEIPAVTINQSGSVGIGTTAPAYTLDVAGQIHSSSGGYVFPDGTTQTTAFIPANCGADYAEAVDVTGDRTKYEPGDLLVIDPDHPGKFLKADQAYSTMVAGVYSTKPGFVGRKQPASDPASKDEVPMAMVGRVPTKVSAENGPIHVGDLLVTSSTMGYAMKGTDRSQMLGAVVGKALGSLDSGTGVIEVLVTLQ